MRAHEVTCDGSGCCCRAGRAVVGVADRAEPLDHVGDRRRPVAERAVGVAGPAGQLDRRRQQHRRQRGEVLGAGRQPEQGRRAVGARAAEQVVVHLHDDLAAGRERRTEARCVDRLRGARRPGAEPGCVVEVGAVGQAAVAEAGPALARVVGVELLGRGVLVGVDAVEDHVVDDVAVVRLHERAGEERVLGQVRVEQEAAVVVGADAVRRRRRVGLSGSAATSGVSPARSGLGLTASTGSAGTTAGWVAARRRRTAARPGRRRSSRRVAARGDQGEGAARRGPRAGSAGWPRQAPSGQHVQVGVEHGLPGVGAGVEHQAVAVVTGVGGDPPAEARPARRRSREPGRPARRRPRRAARGYDEDVERAPEG